MNISPHKYFIKENTEIIQKKCNQLNIDYDRAISLDTNSKKDCADFVEFIMKRSKRKSISDKRDDIFDLMSAIENRYVIMNAVEICIHDKKLNKILDENVIGVFDEGLCINGVIDNGSLKNKMNEIMNIKLPFPEIIITFKNIDGNYRDMFFNIFERLEPSKDTNGNKHIVHSIKRFVRVKQKIKTIDHKVILSTESLWTKAMRERLFIHCINRKKCNEYKELSPYKNTEHDVDSYGYCLRTIRTAHRCKFMCCVIRHIEKDSTLAKNELSSVFSKVKITKGESLDIPFENNHIKKMSENDIEHLVKMYPTTAETSFFDLFITNEIIKIINRNPKKIEIKENLINKRKEYSYDPKKEYIKECLKDTPLIEIKSSIKVYDPKDNPKSRGSSRSCDHEQYVREHERRGHYRELANGKRIWVSSANVKAFRKGIGKKKPGYEIK